MRFKNKNKNRTDELVAFKYPYSIIAEQFRTLRTLSLRLVREKNLKSILVTSATSLEGKSFVASNLAVSIAQGMDNHVLLVDADIRKPNIDKFFNLKSKDGLSDFLFAERALDELIQPTGIPKLSVLTSGPPHNNPSELLASNRMKDFVQEVKDRYEDRYTIIDSAPVLPISDSVALAEQVDCIILVIKAGLTEKKLVRDTIEILGRKKILGVVFNCCQTQPKAYHEYYQTYIAHLTSKTK
jgi:exopolysaccharide/PEP-CTERM locus tyrosine autokinase